MEIIANSIRGKPVFFLLISLGYMGFVGFMKWNVRPPVLSLGFFGGGLLGIYFLDIAEAFFRLSPSPFRSVLFAAAFAAVSFFIVTSSGSLLASGLVLSLYLTLILRQAGEWHVVGNLNSWYRMIAEPVDARTQLLVFIGFMILFLVETFLFIR